MTKVVSNMSQYAIIIYVIYNNMRVYTTFLDINLINKRGDVIKANWSPNGSYCFPAVENYVGVCAKDCASGICAARMISCSSCASGRNSNCRNC